MKILTLNPPFLQNFSRGQRSPAVTKSGTLYYPIWLSYATGALEQAGHEVRLVDAPALDLGYEHVAAMVEEFQPQMIIVDTSTPSIDNDVEIGVKLKKLVPGAVVGAVGPHVSAKPKETLELSSELDFVTLKEYDYTLRDIAETIEGGGNWRELPGIAVQLEGKMVINGPAKLIQDLDELPFVSEVYHRHLNYKKYFYAITRHPVVTIISGRGCPYKCNFCMFPQTLHGHQYRRRSAANVAEEMALVEKLFPDAKEIFIEDDTLTVNKKRVLELCKELKARNTKIKWTCNSRCDVDEETLRAMRDAGCRLLCVGVESGVQEILDNVEKGITLRQIEEFFDAAKRAGVMVHGCFMAGNRGETAESLEVTLEFAKRLNPDTAQFFPLMVYPGTKSYMWAEQNNLIRAASFKDWLDEEGMHASVVDSENLTHEQLVEWCDRARREFYLRPSYMVRKIGQTLRSPAEAGRTLKSFATFSKHLLTRNGS